MSRKKVNSAFIKKNILQSDMNNNIDSAFDSRDLALKYAMKNIGGNNIIGESGPELAFYTDKAGLSKFSKAGFTRTKDEKNLDYTSVEDGSDRYFISDKDMEMKDSKGKTLGARMKHDKMYATDPGLKDIPVTYKDRGNLGSYDIMGKTLNFNPNNKYGYLDTEAGVTLHESQHAVNDRAGWNNGFGHLADVIAGPEAYWNSGNEQQSYMVERLYNEGNRGDYDAHMKNLGKNKVTDSMRNWMERRTGSRLFYEEQPSAERKKIINREKESEEYWKQLDDIELIGKMIEE